jgi:hypothetical protein
VNRAVDASHGGTPMSEHPMIVVHPAAEDVARQLGLAPRLPSLRGARLGLIDNSKHNADAFLRTLETILARDYGIERVERYRKASPSIPTPPEILTRLAESCDALVHGVAD